MFVSAGVQHSTANMGYFSIGLINDVPGVTWFDAVFWNIIPASLGNILGGTIFVAFIIWGTFRIHRDRFNLEVEGSHL